MEKENNIDFKAIKENTRLSLLEEQSRKRKIHRKKIDNKSLEEITKCEGYYGYTPYLIDFETILERVKSENKVDNNENSLKIKMDLAEQLSKMKKYPPLDTICHIESDDYNKSTRLRYWFLKRVLFQRKYRIVFHKNITDFDNMFYNYKVSNGMETLFIALGVIGFFVSVICFLIGFKFISLFIIFAYIASLFLFF